MSKVYIKKIKALEQQVRDITKTSFDEEMRLKRCLRKANNDNSSLRSCVIFLFVIMIVEAIIIHVALR